MNLTTIWDLSINYSLKERFKRTGEWALRKAAHHMPERLAYWVVIDRTAKHIRSDEVVLEVRAMDIVQRMRQA